jgi:hypothetical protein
MKILRNRPQLVVDQELRNICESILAEGKSAVEWDRVESDDLIQTAHYKGGYDATEQEFCFSYYDGARKEWWFQFSYAEAGRIAAGELTHLDIREPG